MKRVPHSTHSLQYFFYFVDFLIMVILISVRLFLCVLIVLICISFVFSVLLLNIICVLPLIGFKIFLFVFDMLQFSLFFPFSFHLYVPQGGLYLFILPEFDDFFHLWINIFNQVWKIFGNYLLRYFVFCLIFSLYSYMLLAYIYNSLSLVHTICKLWLTFFILSSFFTSD